MSTPDLPLALRPTVAIPPRRRSVFEDPSDERSWQLSQHFESLVQFYEGREPAWYASVVRPFSGSRRVLELGSGPGLALRAMRGGGVAECVGLDRWPGFAATATGDGITTLLHDLTLPAPFLASESFDGVLSHYVFDYISPIAVRQMLRETRRLLEPGGLMVLYLAAVGLAGGDEARTIPYSADVMRTLLREAGFADFSVDPSANGRNVTVEARAAGAERPPAGQAEARMDVGAEAQLEGAFEGFATASSVRIEFETSVAGRRDTVAFDTDARERLAFCVRAVPLSVDAGELQFWVWSGSALLRAEATRVELLPDVVSVRCSSGRLEHWSVWHPQPLALEPGGSAYVRPEELPPPLSGDRENWSGEPRYVVVEPRDGLAGPVGDVLGRQKNRFLVRRARTQDGWADPARLEKAWLAGELHGLVIDAGELHSAQAQGSLVWALETEALLYVEATDWGTAVAAVEPLVRHARAPVVLVDPALSGTEDAGDLSPALRASEAAEPLHLLVSGVTARLVPAGTNVLLATADDAVGDELAAAASETLRYVTDRTVVIRTRRQYWRPPAEIGRRPALG